MYEVTRPDGLKIQMTDAAAQQHRRLSQLQQEEGWKYRKVSNDDTGESASTQSLTFSPVATPAPYYRPEDAINNDVLPDVSLTDETLAEINRKLDTIIEWIVMNKPNVDKVVAYVTMVEEKTKEILTFGSGKNNSKKKPH